jgi:hypothetical protein
MGSGLKSSKTLLAAAGDGAILAGPVGTTPLEVSGGSGSDRPGDNNWFQREERTATLGGQPGRGTENWLGKEHWGGGGMTDTGLHGVKGRWGEKYSSRWLKGRNFP